VTASCGFLGATKSPARGRRRCASAESVRYAHRSSFVWAALHDSDVLRASIPGCRELVPVDAGTYAATLHARVGPVADTYRGAFSIEDLRPGSELRVCVEGQGRCGRLELELRVTLAERRSGATELRYDAHATVSGLVTRLGKATLTVAGGHLTGCFFRDLDRSLRPRARPARLTQLMTQR
jgi:carbon monoxide dehydrogenase subunit G